MIARTKYDMAQLYQRQQGQVAAWQYHNAPQVGHTFGADTAVGVALLRNDKIGDDEESKILLAAEALLSLSPPHAPPRKLLVDGHLYMPYSNRLRTALPQTQLANDIHHEAPLRTCSYERASPGSPFSTGSTTSSLVPSPYRTEKSVWMNNRVRVDPRNSLTESTCSVTSRLHDISFSSKSSLGTTPISLEESPSFSKKRRYSVDDASPTSRSSSHKSREGEIVYFAPSIENQMALPPSKQVALEYSFDRCEGNSTSSIKTTEDLYFETVGVIMALPTDEEFLSPLHCFMRRYCVEVFTATTADLGTPRFGGGGGIGGNAANKPLGKQRIVLGQVGLRCMHCKHRSPRDREERAVCFPSSLKNIYHSIETWQRRHSHLCRDLPSWIKQELQDLMRQSKMGAGGRRQYWEESARQLGMENTPDQGIRFIRCPKANAAQFAGGLRDERNAAVRSFRFPNSVGLVSCGAQQPHHPSPATSKKRPHEQCSTSSPIEFDSPYTNSSSMIGRTQYAQGTPGSLPVVQPEDKCLVTDYLYLLMEQMETCVFQDEDRQGGRSKVKDSPIGYAGMQCKHCSGKAGFGRYFPATVQALTSANSDRNVHNHILKCRRCPAQVRGQLQQLQQEQPDCKNKRGSRKQFFRRVWDRMHRHDEYRAATLGTMSSSTLGSYEASIEQTNDARN